MFGLSGKLIAGAIAIAAALAALGWCIHLIQSETARADKYEALYNTALQRAASLTLDYSKQDARADAAEKLAADNAKKGEVHVQTVVNAIPGGRGISLPADFKRVLDATNDVVNPGDGSSTTGSEPASESISVASETYDEHDFAQYIVDAGLAYQDATTKLTNCANRYNEARQAQLENR